jgi:hypothetical protein
MAEMQMAGRRGREASAIFLGGGKSHGAIKQQAARRKSFLLRVIARNGYGLSRALNSIINS